jgi:hypothetical protein
VTPVEDLGGLLANTEVFVRRFVVLTEEQATAVVLWATHTWVIAAAHATPYLYATSAEPESGKTRLLEVLHELVREPISTVNISDAALFRVIDAKAPTVLFDEVDSVFSEKAREREDLRALLNAGYRRGATVYRMGGGNRTTLENFAVFCAKALAGLGSLPPTTASRCLRIELKRRRLDELVEDFYPDELVDDATRLRTRFAAWADAETVSELRALRPPRLEELRDRANEVWRPLLAIADHAGGDWPARARRAAVVLSARVDEDPSLGLLLLADLQAIFEDREDDRITTDDLVRALAAVEESPWGEWWIDAKTNEPLKGAPRRLAQLLRPYGIRPGVVRIGTTTPRGYLLKGFRDAWERFPAPPRDDDDDEDESRGDATSATSATPEPQSQADVADVADVAQGRDEDEAPSP